MTITLTREEAQQVLDALQCATPPTFSAKIVEDWEKAVEFLRARLAQPEPEPVAWHELGAYGNVTVYKDWAKENGWQPFYTAPPQREWQGLTDEEYEAMAEQYVTNCYFDTLKYARAIEAKLKEKNNG